eukprot:47183-Pelagomonas_calceolata.AAC.4
MRRNRLNQLSLILKKSLLCCWGAHTADVQRAAVRLPRYVYTVDGTQCIRALQTGSSMTGSGKTFTIYGTEEEPGLTRHGINELFRVCDDKRVCAMHYSSCVPASAERQDKQAHSYNPHKPMSSSSAQQGGAIVTCACK